MDNLQVCGKPVLRCGHPCMEKAGMDHMCICSRKRKFDPGCQHSVSGDCSDFANLRLTCLEACQKPQICGYPCSQPCSSNACFCGVCFETLSNGNPLAVHDKKAMGFKPMIATAGTTAEPGPGPSKMPSAAIPIPGFPLKRSDSWDEDEEDWDAPETTFEVFVVNSENELNQVKKRMGVLDKNHSGVWGSMRFYNLPDHDHNFDADPDGYQASGYPFKAHPSYMNNVNANFSESDVEMDPVPDFSYSANAWKFGMTKCPNGHSFRAEFRCCKICGLTSASDFPGLDADCESD